MTVYDLLMTCPDDQITRMQIAWRDVAFGDWKSAALHLGNAAMEGDSSWHDRCADLAEEYRNK